jgi:hypothetical protein
LFSFKPNLFGIFMGFFSSLFVKSFLYTLY